MSQSTALLHEQDTSSATIDAITEKLNGMSHSKLLEVYCFVAGLPAPAYVSTGGYGWICYIGSIQKWSVSGVNYTRLESGRTIHDQLALAALDKLMVEHQHANTSISK